MPNPAALPDDAPRAQKAAAWAVERLIERDLKRTFRRIVWLGPEPWQKPLAPDRPLVLYANHHAFHDGYFLWLLACRVMGRPALLWMEDWEQIPLFGPLGTLPFPPDDPRQRLATIRETARRLHHDPRHVFLYFPEGALRPPDAGLGDFTPQRFEKLARLFPASTRWWPVGIHVTWWGEDRPTVLLAGGEPHDAPDGRERERLAQLLDDLRRAQPGAGRILLEGAQSAHERWNLARLAPFLRRLT